MRILIIEDEVTLSKTLSEGLKEYKCVMLRGHGPFAATSELGLVSGH